LRDIGKATYPDLRRRLRPAGRGTPATSVRLVSRTRSMAVTTPPLDAITGRGLPSQAH